MATLMVGAGDGPVDELLNEQPIFTPNNIGQLFPQSPAAVRLLDQAARATLNITGGLHRAGALLQGG
jgi:hypothetical protein